MKSDSLILTLATLLGALGAACSSSEGNGNGGSTGDAGGGTPSSQSGTGTGGSTKVQQDSLSPKGGGTGSSAVRSSANGGAGGARSQSETTDVAGTMSVGGIAGGSGKGTATTRNRSTHAGGAAGKGGASTTSDATGTGGASHVSTTAGTGGTSNSGTGSSKAGASNTGGATNASTASTTEVPAVTGPCDIYSAANTPCVAAHSTVRALYGTYSGRLYQLRRASDKTTQDISVLSPGGFADTSAQDTFCKGTTCTISIIYDQSTNHNDLPKSPKVTYLTNGGAEANAADAKISVSGHTVHGIYVTGNSSYESNPGIQTVAYRNNNAKGLAKNDEAESMYMVLDGKRYSNLCCFDYGNAEPSGRDDGDATMEAIYWGSDTKWARGGGNGPWIAGDLENGMYKGDSKNTPSNTSITGWSYVTAILKGPSGNHFGLKAGNAQSGKLEVKWNGARPPGYSPMKKLGAIILGTGGDGSSGGTGTFFEGAITKGNPPDEVDDAIQANIVAAGYGS